MAHRTVHGMVHGMAHRTVHGMVHGMVRGMARGMAHGMVRGMVQCERACLVGRELVHHDRERRRVGKVGVQVGHLVTARQLLLVRVLAQVRGDVVVDPAHHQLVGADGVAPARGGGGLVVVEQLHQLRRMPGRELARELLFRQVPHEPEHLVWVGVGVRVGVGVGVRVGVRVRARVRVMVSVSVRV